MSENHPETWVTKGLDWLVPLAQRHKARLGVYFALIVAFWTALAALPTALDPFLPPLAKEQPFKRNLLAVGVGLGMPTLVILLAEGLPALLQLRRDRRLIDWGLRKPAEHGYFRLTPYERRDRDGFRRADQADAEVLAWLREAEPTVLYLTGRSGVGKSSLLNAAVLPALEAGKPTWSVVTVRTFGDAAAGLVAALRRPGLVYKQPPKDLPGEVLPLLRRLDERLGERDGWLLIVLDQFEEFLVFHGHDWERQEPLLRLLADLEREPLERVRLLLSLRADYLVDLARLGLPRLHHGRNWMQVDAFTESAARDFLQAGFGGDGLGAELLTAVVRHAAELDEVRGKMRPIVLNMIGQALAARSGETNRVVRAGEARRLIFDHVREGLNDPLSRDHAPEVLAKMVTPDGNKERPNSADDLAARTHLSVLLVQGCLTRLNQLGFVRTFEADREGTPGTQVWEVSHDFVASVLGFVLPGWRSTFGRRARRALGPAFLVAGIAGIFGLVAYEQARTRAGLERVDQIQRWGGMYGATLRRLDDGMFEVRFDRPKPPPDFVAAIHADCSGFANLVNSLDLRANGLTSLPPEVTKLTGLTTLDLGLNRLTSLPPEVTKLTGLTTLDLGFNGTGLTSLPAEIGKLTGLTTLDLRANGLTSLPAEIGKLTSLTTLDLGGNGLTSLPPEIGKLTGLTTLDLRGTGLTSLPPEVTKLTSLTTLNLSSNRLTSLPPEVTKLTGLTTLDLGFNGLTSLPPEIGKLTGLTTLNLRANGLTSLPPEICHLKGLESLYIDDNPLADPPRTVVERGVGAIRDYLCSKPAAAAGAVGKPQ